MKMVKGALLLSAAGIVAASGAQAADLPVKAKPVEYVKVCSLYGAGFYYIPGTDICMKVGGYVRYQVNSGEGQSISFGPFFTTGGFDTRQTGVDVNQRVRALATFDTRQQTAYGTLRTYVILGYTHDTNAVAIGPTPSVYMNRGFIQLAGFTFGKATSFFDFVSTAAVAYNAGFVATSDTGDAGQIVGAYTAQFGNGLSATVGIEQSRRNATVWMDPAGLKTPNATLRDNPSGTPSTPSFAFSYVPFTLASGDNADNLGGLNAGTASYPDIVGNIRIDQAWGSAQFAAAAHDVTPQYYGGPIGTPAITTASGHPGSKWGWAVSGGLRLNAPMIGPGDYFQTAVNYAQGATRYTSFSGCAQAYCNQFSGNTVGFGFGEDAIFTGTAAAPGFFDLTTSWSVFASYEHFWTPSLRTSVYGSYFAASHTAEANAAMCNNLEVGGIGNTQCNMNFQTWDIGTRSQWNITKDLYIGVDVIYSRLQSATVNNNNPVFLNGAQIGKGPGATPPNTAFLPTGMPNGYYQTGDQDAVSVTWRVHRDIVP